MSAPRPFRCGVCSQEFARSENLQRHRTSRHGDAARHKFECTKCHTRFHRRDVCKRHAQRCTGYVSHSRSRRLSPETASTHGVSQTMLPLSSPLAEASESGNAENATTTFGMTEEAITQTVDAYFVHFHCSLPILHRPTFSLATAPVSLLRIVVAIGSLHMVSALPSSERQQAQKEADDHWERGRKELKSLVVKDRKEVWESWVIQAFVLHVIYGVYRGSGSRLQKARSMFRTIVDHMRDLELFHQTLTAADDLAWETDLSPSLDSNERLLDSKWAAFISKESLKLSLYALVLIDFHVFKVCNLRPMISSIELGWELPHAAFLWEADTSKAWLEALYRDGCGAAVSINTTTTKYAFQSTATKSLTLATQSLMSGSPCPHLIAALAASPFAALCLAANVDNLVQDFTRCYYQMPPSLSDPSLFHILTQAQNKNVAAALHALSNARSIASCAADADDRRSVGLWRAVHLVVTSVRASLCVPDDLLIGGIVDNGVAAGLATHAHLTLGSYFASRRSAMQQQHASGGVSSELDAAGTLSLLSELMPALEHVVKQSTADAVCDEGPWVGVVIIRLLITIWKTLRLVIEYVRQNNSSEGLSGSGSSFDPAGVMLREVTRTVDEYIRRLVPDHQADVDTNIATLEMDVGYHERCFLSLAVELCRRRPVWPVGPALATVFEEIMTAIV